MPKTSKLTDINSVHINNLGLETETDEY